MSHPNDFNRHLCLGVDLERYSANSAQSQADLQRQLKKLLEEAARAAGLDRDGWLIQAQGDGELALIPVGPDEPVVIDTLVRNIESLLASRNDGQRWQVRMRLRLALHTGVAYQADLGFAGAAPVVVSRLLQSQSLRHALALFPTANLAVICSETAFEVVQQGHTTLKTENFRRVPVTAKEYRGVGWIWVPGAPSAALDRLTQDLTETGATTGARPTAARHVGASAPIVSAGPSTLHIAGATASGGEARSGPTAVGDGATALQGAPHGEVAGRDIDKSKKYHIGSIRLGGGALTALIVVGVLGVGGASVGVFQTMTAQAPGVSEPEYSDQPLTGYKSFIVGGATDLDSVDSDNPGDGVPDVVADGSTLNATGGARIGPLPAGLVPSPRSCADAIDGFGDTSVVSTKVADVVCVQTSLGAMAALIITSTGSRFSFDYTYWPLR